MNRFGGGEILSLHDVPPIIPDEFQGKDREVVRLFIQHMRSYKEIFDDGADPGSGLIKQADTLLTSVGIFHQWTGFDTELLNAVGITPEELTRLCKGDIGGALIEIEPLAGNDLKRFNEIQAAWTGASLEHYRRVAVQSGENETPGVIVCATGANKWSVLYDLVTEKKVINQLLICDSLANALNKRSTNIS